MTVSPRVVTPSLHAEDISVAQKSEQRFDIKVPLSGALDIGARCSATLAEANLISIMSDAELQRPAKRRKIETQMKRLEQWSQAFASDVNASVHKRVMTESMALLYAKT